MIIDLCSGIGRWETNKQVIGIDINPITKPTILASISYLPLREGIKPDLVHASPPCKYFSYARYPSQRWDNCKNIADSLRLVADCFEAFEHLEAKTWTLENPVGRLAKLLNETKIHYKAGDYNKKATIFLTNMRSLKRSIIPQDIRQKILKTTEYELEQEPSASLKCSS